MGPEGPELKEKEEVVGRISADWGGILCGGTMSAAEITQCTLDLSDDTACRVHCVAWRAPAAAAATKYDCVVALVGNRRDDLQEVLGRVAFLAMTDEDIEDLNATMRQWAARRGKQWTARAEPNLRGHGQHATEMEAARRKEEKKVEALVAMLRGMGVSEESVRKRLEGADQEQPWQQTDGDGDAPMPQATSEVLVIDDADGEGAGSETARTEIQDTPENMSATMAWAPPRMTQGTEDSYLGTAGSVREPNEQDEEEEESIRPMTHQEIMDTWGGGQVKTERGWRKGLGKNCDRPGDWGNLREGSDGDATLPPTGSGDQGDHVRETGQIRPRRLGVGMQRPRQNDQMGGHRYETRAQHAKRRRMQGPPGGGCDE